MLKRWSALGLASLLVAGCGDEGPVGLDGLVPDDVVRTYEIILDADAFLARDTAIVGFREPSNTPYYVVAQDHAGALNARGLARFALASKISYNDSAGTSVTDQPPRWIGGRLIVRVDTLAPRPDGPVELALHLTTEAWDGGSATWQFRVDTAGVQEPWTEPGGSPGALIDTETLEVDADSLVFTVDSQTVALWADTLDPGPGALITMATPGGRVRLARVTFVADARPLERPDTVIADTASLRDAVFIFDPPPADGGRLVVGGTPTWRSYLLLKQRLDTLAVAVPCPDDPAENCSIRLGDATVNYAALLLQAETPPAGFAPLDTVGIEVRLALGAGEIPFSRAPLSSRVGTPVTFDAEVFENPGGPVDLPVTGAVAGLTRAPEESGLADGVRENPVLVLLPTVEGDQFGYGSFASSRSGSAPPRLRMLISVVSEDLVR